MEDERYMKQLGKMARPVPGSSMTNDPQNPLPFEGPPEFTNKKDAIEEIFQNMTKEDVYVPMIEALERGTSVMDITQVVLFEGFRQGKWNPDMLMLLAEPTAYMAMALAERAGVDAEVDYEPQEGQKEAKELTQLETNLNKVKSKMSGKVPTGVLPSEIEKKIEEMPQTESLLSRKPPEQPAPEQMEDSLLARGVA